MSMNISHIFKIIKAHVEKEKALEVKGAFFLLILQISQGFCSVLFSFLATDSWYICIILLCLYYPVHFTRFTEKPVVQCTTVSCVLRCPTGALHVHPCMSVCV